MKDSLASKQTVLNGTPLFRLASFLLYHCVAIPFLFVVGFLVYGLKAKGRKNFRGYRSGLIASNHCQYLEPGLNAMLLWPRRIFYSAEENNVTRPDVGWLTRLLRTFGIPDTNPLGIAPQVRDALRRNWFVHFYPEGVIGWRCQEPGPLMDGVFFFAFLNNVPVFPVTEVLRERPIRRIFSWWPPQTTFVYGMPIFPDDFRVEGVPRRRQIHNMSEYVRNIMIETIEKEGGNRELAERRPAGSRFS